MEDATHNVWMHRSKAETDHGRPVAGKGAIDAAVAAGLYEERVLFGGKDKDGKPVRTSQIRVKEQGEPQGLFVRQASRGSRGEPR